MNEDRLLSAKEVADWLQLNERTVINLAVRGELMGAKIANKWRFLRADVLDYIRRQQETSREGR